MFLRIFFHFGLSQHNSIAYSDYYSASCLKFVTKYVRIKYESRCFPRCFHTYSNKIYSKCPSVCVINITNFMYFPFLKCLTESRL